MLFTEEETKPTGIQYHAFACWPIIRGGRVDYLKWSPMFAILWETILSE